MAATGSSCRAEGRIIVTHRHRTATMDQTEYEEDILYRKLNSVQTMIEDGNTSEKDLLEQICSLLEIILRDNWWEVGGRISRSKTMFGTGYKARYELVKNNMDIKTVKGKGNADNQRT